MYVCVHGLSKQMQMPMETGGTDPLELLWLPDMGAGS